MSMQGGDVTVDNGFGKSEAGNPVTHHAAGFGADSKTVTACPLQSRNQAAVRPAGPAPTMATFFPVFSEFQG